MTPRTRSILRAVGGVQTFAPVMVLPSIAFGVTDGSWLAFVESGLVMLGLGVVLLLLGRGQTSELRLRDGFLVTALVWLTVSFAAALPLHLGAPYLSITDAVFESVSALTTTGATVISGLDHLPDSVRFYRQFLQFFGGMGIVILAVAILPALRIGATQLTKGETTGPVKDTKLTPRIAETARALWRLYLGLTLACFFAYWLAGMNAFDAIGHTFSTVSTGGFSSYDASIAYFDSVLIELVCVVFMLASGISFALHFIAWRNGSARAYMRDAEFRTFIRLWLFSVGLVTVSLWIYEGYPSFSIAFRESLLQVTSNITSTGFTRDGFAQWPAFLPAYMMVIALIGACAGSTTGGLKVIRCLVVAKLAWREVLRIIHPRAEFVVKLDRAALSDRMIEAVAGFMAVFFLTLVLLSMAMMASGVELVDAFSATASSLANLGPALGTVAGSMQSLNDFSTWICTIAMILGRLELITLLVLLTPAFWRE
jgi:trk system potassium uptake protein TrkH